MNDATNYLRGRALDRLGLSEGDAEYLERRHGIHPTALNGCADPYRDRKFGPGSVLIDGYDTEGQRQSGQRWNIRAEASAWSNGRDKPDNTRCYLPGAAAPTFLLRPPINADKPVLLLEGVTDGLRALTQPAYMNHVVCMADVNKLPVACRVMQETGQVFVAVLDDDGDDHLLDRLAHVLIGGGLPLPACGPAGTKWDFSDWWTHDNDRLRRLLEEAFKWCCDRPASNILDPYLRMADAARKDFWERAEAARRKQTAALAVTPTRDPVDSRALSAAVESPGVLRAALEAVGCVDVRGRWSCPDKGHDPERQRRDPGISVDGPRWCCHGGKHTGRNAGTAYHLLTDYGGMTDRDAAGWLLDRAGMRV